MQGLGVPLSSEVETTFGVLPGVLGISLNFLELVRLGKCLELGFKIRV